MVVPFATHTVWDLWIRPIVRADPLPKGSGGGVVEVNIINRQQLNRYKGSGRNKKLPPRRLPTVGIVQKVLCTTNTTIHNITTMVVPFAPFTAWDIWIRPSFVISERVLADGGV